MATWSSTPSVPHTGGTFDFPENTGTKPKVYTIIYTDDNGHTVSTTHTVKSCNCGRYGFIDRNTSVASSSGTPIVAESLSNADTLTFSSSDSSNWITFNRTETFGNKIYICNVTENTGQDIRIGFAVFTSSDGCEFTATVTQNGQAQETYEIGYTLTSTSTRLSTKINYIHGSASIFTQSELSTAIDIIPYTESQESGCEALSIKTITLADLLALEVGNQLYDDVVGTNLCIVSGIRLIVPTDPTNIRERIVLTQRG